MRCVKLFPKSRFKPFWNYHFLRAPSNSIFLCVLTQRTWPENGASVSYKATQPKVWNVVFSMSMKGNNFCVWQASRISSNGQLGVLYCPLYSGCCNWIWSSQFHLSKLRASLRLHIWNLRLFNVLANLKTEFKVPKSRKGNTNILVWQFVFKAAFSRLLSAV